MEQKKNIRAMIEEKIKALKEKRQAEGIPERKVALPPRMQELLEKAKDKAKERGAVSPKGAMTPTLLKEKMLTKRNELKSIIEKKQQLNKKEVSHD